MSIFSNVHVQSSSGLTISRNTATTVLPSPAPSDELSPIISVDHQSQQPITNGDNRDLSGAAISSIADVSSAPATEPRAQNPTSSKRRFPQSHSTICAGEIPEDRPPIPVAETLPLPAPIIPPPSHPSNSPQATSSRSRPQNPSSSASSPIVSLTTVSPDVHSNLTDTFLENPHKRQRTLQAAMPRAWLPLIDARIASLGGLKDLDSNVEIPRYILLKRACREDDTFYVALHQLFCIWYLNPDEVARIPGFPRNSVLEVAFQYIGHLIRDNENLTPSHNTWFASFPTSLAHMLTIPGLYRNTIALVGNFLDRFAADWQALSFELTVRKYPPLMDELTTRLELFSPIFQDVVSTAARRNMGITERELTMTMDKIFKKDQMKHQKLLTRCQTDYSATQTEMLEHTECIKSEYLKAYYRFMEKRPPSNPSSNNPMTQLLIPVAHTGGQFQAISQVSSQQLSMSSPTGNVPPVRAQQRRTSGQVSHGLVNHGPIHRQPQTIDPQQFALNNSNLISPYLANSFPQQGGLMRNNNSHMGQEYPARTHSLTRPPNRRSRSRSVLSPHQLQVSRPQIAPMPTQLTQNWGQQLSMQHIWQPPQNLQQEQQQQPFYTQQQGLPQGIASLNWSNARRESINPVSMQQIVPPQANRISSGSYRTPNLIPVTAPNPPLGSPTLNSNVGYYNVPRLVQRPFMPPLGYVHQPQSKKPEISALHQAHLRSPRLVAVGTPSSEVGQKEPRNRYYQAVKRFLLPPTIINDSHPLSKFDFLVTMEDFGLIPNDLSNGPGQVALRQFRDGALQFRLRCIQVEKNVMITTPDWVVRDTVWPENACIDINNYHLEIRRKNHYGKDLPIDITAFLRNSGPGATNQVSISIIKGRSTKKDNDFYLAVEVIEILGHAKILGICQQKHISVDHTLESIKKSLVGPVSGGDDDFAMVVSDLAIGLADPFTSLIFETPVRGTFCLHRECFDLETYLLTRASKPKRPDQPCMIDVWKCPLCGKDARPYSLIIDDFMASVQSSLHNHGQLNVKAIWISPDGTWRPKTEKSTGIADPNDSDDSDDDGNLRRYSTSKEDIRLNQNQKVIELIELDDE
jgi:hypothetical protein